MTLGSFRQGSDDISECGQGLIDVFRLFKNGALGSSFANFFRTSQVDKIEFSGKFLLGLLVLLGNLNLKNAVGARRMLVHVCVENNAQGLKCYLTCHSFLSVVLSFLDNVHNLGKTADIRFSHILDIRHLVFALVYRQIGLGDVQEISYLLVVYFLK